MPKRPGDRLHGPPGPPVQEPLLPQGGLDSDDEEDSEPVVTSGSEDDELPGAFEQSEDEQSAGEDHEEEGAVRSQLEGGDRARHRSGEPGDPGG